MAKKLYKAKIGTKHIMVDLEHLPYGEYNEKTPLVIIEKVLLEKALQYTNLANVHFSAGIEMQNTVLPTESVNEILITKPVEITVEEYLENPFARRNLTLDFDAMDYHVQSEKTEPAKEQKPAVVKPVKKEKKKKTVAKPVVEKAPIESVIALVESVAKTKEKQATAKVTKTEQKTVQPVPVQPVETKNIKNSDVLSIDDIMKICLRNEFIMRFDLPETKLEQEIRKIFKTFQVKYYTDPVTNSKVKCISSSNIGSLVKKLQETLAKMSYKTPSVQQRKAEEQPESEPQKRKQLVSRKEISVVPITIKKYIPKRLWKDICKSCGKHEMLKKAVIDNIRSLNADLNETYGSGHIQIIDMTTEARRPLAYIKRKDKSCIVQSVTDTLNKDNKRIVWTYLPQKHIYVCTAFFLEHTKTKKGNDYERVCDYAADRKDAKGRDIIASDIASNENYLDVDDLWAKFNQPQTAQIKTEKPVETRSGNQPVKPTVKPTEVKTPISANVENVKGPASVDIEDVKGPTNAEIEQAKSGLTKEEGTEPEKPVIIPDKPVANLSDVIVAQKQVEAVIKLINATVNDNIQSITTEENTQKQIEEIDLIRAALVKKQALQNALSEMSGLDTLLAQIKTIKQR